MPPVNVLYCVEPIQEIIETAMFTSCIRDEVPVSLILVGPSGIAKSMMLSRYQSDQLHHTDSFSSQGLFDIASRDQKGEVRFLVVPDINPTLSRRPTTVQSTIANLLSFTADGTVRVDDGREQKECRHAPVGILTAATDDMYLRQAKKWFALGLRRRILPVFFRYSPETIAQLQAMVREDKIRSSMPPKIEIKLGVSAKPAIPKELDMEIQSYAIALSNLLGKLSTFEKQIKKWYVREVVPISPQVVLKNLVRAHALREGRAAATHKDTDFVARFVGFCDPEHPRQI